MQKTLVTRAERLPVIRKSWRSHRRIAEFRMRPEVRPALILHIAPRRFKSIVITALGNFVNSRRWRWSRVNNFPLCTTRQS